MTAWTNYNANRSCQNNFKQKFTIWPLIASPGYIFIFLIMKRKIWPFILQNSISPHDLKTEPQKECDRLTHPLTDISSIIYRLRFLKFSLSENYTHFSVKNWWPNFSPIFWSKLYPPPCCRIIEEYKPLHNTLTLNKNQNILWNQI